MIVGVISNYKEKRLALARSLINYHIKKGKLVLPLLELPYGTDSHSSMRIENRALTHLIFRARKLGIVIVWSTLRKSWIDKRIRILTDELWLYEKRTIWQCNTETQKCREIKIKPNALVSSETLANLVRLCSSFPGQSEKRKKRA